MEVPIKCPICSTVFTVDIRELKDTIICRKCKTPLELKVLPQVKTVQDVYLLTLTVTLQNINRLYTTLSKAIERLLGV